MQKIRSKREESQMKHFLGLYAKEMINHLYATTRFARIMLKEHPEIAREVFRKMKGPKPEDLDDLIHGSVVMLAEIVLEDSP